MSTIRVCVEEAPKVKLKNPAELRAADIDMGYVLYSLLAALNMAAVTSMVQNELSIAKKRRECSGPAPTHATETRAQACLGKLGMMHRGKQQRGKQFVSKLAPR